VEALLVRAGALPRAGRVEDGTTALDTDDVEIARGHSTALAAAAVEHGGVKLNLLDTPGGPDFVGELRAGLRAGDAALFVVSAAGGLDARTAQLWEECAAVGMPRAVVVSQLDRPRADFDETVALAQRLLGEDVHPLHVPMHADDGGVAGLIDLLRLRVSDWSSGSAVERDPDPEHVTLVEGLRSDLLEAVIAESEDETLLDRYLAGDPLDPAVLVRDFEQAVARGHFHPVLAVSPLQGAGTDELLDLLVAGFPSPLEHGLPPATRPDGAPADPLRCDPAGPLAAEVVRTSTDPFLGRVSLVRVFSGTLRPGHAGARLRPRRAAPGARRGRARRRPRLSAGRRAAAGAGVPGRRPVRRPAPALGRDR
jgi:elongation factor G